ncbi:MAG: DUF4395 family protein, partial [Mariniphaga sp.]|nr:DUF4395 family protein [Mariniphaga sp.]
MKALKQIVCPISEERINEQITRSNAMFAILFVVTSLVFQSVYFILFLMADFYIRAFTRLNISPINFLSRVIVNALNLNKKETGKAQKVFAARMGFLMTLI